MRVISAAYLCALICTAPLYAAQPTWPKEPRAVLGITLGAPLPDTIPTCYTGPQTVDEMESFCVEYSPDSDESLENMRIAGIRALGIVHFYHRKVERLTFSLPHDAYALVKAVLLERYGPPTSTRTETVQTSGGAKMDSAVMLWEGKHVSLDFVEFAGIDISAIGVVDNDLSAKSAKAFKRAVKKYASQM